MNIGIYIYQDAEVLDFSGPFEVFSTANRFLQAPHQVRLIAEHQDIVKARGGFNVMPDHSISDHPPLDVLIVVGGIHDKEMFNRPVIDWLAQQSRQVKIIASVCTGAFLLAEAQLLSGLTVTTHWEDIADLRARYPDINVVTDVRWVEQGDLLTSGGISAGIDMSLHLVARLYGLDIAHKTAKQMEFDWRTSRAY